MVAGEGREGSALGSVSLSETKCHWAGRDVLFNPFPLGNDPHSGTPRNALELYSGKACTGWGGRAGRPLAGGMLPATEYNRWTPKQPANRDFCWRLS